MLVSESKFERKSDEEIYCAPEQHSKCKCLESFRLARSLIHSLNRLACRSFVHMSAVVYFVSLTHRTYSIFRFQCFRPFRRHFHSGFTSCLLTSKSANKWVVRASTWNESMYAIEIEQKKHIHYSGKHIECVWDNANIWTIQVHVKMIWSTLTPNEYCVPKVVQNMFLLVVGNCIRCVRAHAMMEWEMLYERRSSLSFNFELSYFHSNDPKVSRLIIPQICFSHHKVENKLWNIISLFHNVSNSQLLTTDIKCEWSDRFGNEFLKW